MDFLVLTWYIFVMSYEKILIFGDSITWGADDSDGLGWANRYRKNLENKEVDTAVYNLGIRGDTSGGLLKRFEIEADARKADNLCIVFAIGINDSRFVNNLETPETQIEQFKSNIEKLVNSASKFSKNIVFVGLTNVSPDKVVLPRVDKNYIYTNSNIQIYNQVVQEIAKEKGHKFISLQNLIKPEDLYEDGLHPNSQGHIKMCDEISKYIV